MTFVIKFYIEKNVVKLLDASENRKSSQLKLIDWKYKDGLRFSLLADVISFLGAATKRLQGGGNRLLQWKFPLQLACCVV